MYIETSSLGLWKGLVVSRWGKTTPKMGRFILWVFFQDGGLQAHKTLWIEKWRDQEFKVAYFNRDFSSLVTIE